MTLTDPAAEARAAHGPEAVVESAGTVEMALPAEARAVGIARRYVTQRWNELEEGVLDDVELIVSELVSNAVRHGEPEIIFRLRVKPFAVDVTVRDHGPGIPATGGRSVDGTATSGRGLHLVDQLADRWGVDAQDDNGAKTVWANILR